MSATSQPHLKSIIVTSQDISHVSYRKTLSPKRNVSLFFIVTLIKDSNPNKINFPTYNVTDPLKSKTEYSNIRKYIGYLSC